MKIYSSKLFKSNPRQSKIKATIESPVNMELVRQLESYITDPLFDDNHDTDSKYDNSNLNTDNSNKHLNDDTDNSAKSDKHVLRKNTLHTDISDSHDEISDDHQSDEISDEFESDEDKFESTDDDFETREDEAINSNSQLNMLDTDNIKNVLNAEDTTCGVYRITIRNNELWIYYDDKINLNNVMGNVITRLDEYKSLFFNRLARSDNAIVFEINDGQ